MSPRFKPWLGLGVALASLLLAFTSPVAAALVAFAGYFYAQVTTFVLNVPPSRLAVRLAGAGHAVGILLATDNAALAGGALAIILVGWPPIELWGRVDGRGFDLQSIAAFAIGVVTLLLAGPFDTTALVFAPLMLWCGFGAVASTLQARGTWPFTPERTALSVGAPVPDFDLPARAGQPRFRLSEHRGTPLLVCFLRGDWCPICQVMMRIYLKEAPRLAEYGLKLVAVSPSHGDDAEAFFSEMGLDYLVLMDEKSRLAERFGLIEGERSGEAFPLPVSLLIDADGVLRYVSRPHDFSAFDQRSRVLSLLDAEPTGPSA